MKKFYKLWCKQTIKKYQIKKKCNFNKKSIIIYKFKKKMTQMKSGEWAVKENYLKFFVGLIDETFVCLYRK